MISVTFIYYRNTHLSKLLEIASVEKRMAKLDMGDVKERLKN